MRAEWTKLRSQRSSGLALLAMVGFMLLLSILAASLGKSSLNDSVLTVDQFHFVHQPMTGDGTLTVRVTSQTGSAAWALVAGNGSLSRKVWVPREPASSRTSRDDMICPPPAARHTRRVTDTVAPK